MAPSNGNFSTPRRELIFESGQNVLSGEMRIAEQERDDVLLRRAAKGDEEAFTLIYRRHQAAMYRFALRMTGNTWAAHDGKYLGRGRNCAGRVHDFDA
ncbi:MAG: hypothetical protein AUH66_02495 [Acidobacteria bacterium 13_1_40CM_4_57_6]|nr:MAG: hypothetical protein AUH66_02495 [Acidobacteria bacterium 13_1_40CM_4_57_6]